MATGAVAAATSAVGPRRAAVSYLALGAPVCYYMGRRRANLLWLLLAMLMVREFIRVGCPATGLIRPLTLASLPLIALPVSVIVLRFGALS